MRTIEDIENEAMESAKSWSPAWRVWHESVASRVPRGRGIEVGVAYGGHLAYLNAMLPCATLCGVDPYEPYGDPMSRSAAEFDQMFQWVFSRLQPSVKLYRQKGAVAVETFRRMGDRFDWVFIDAAHDEASVEADIAAWAPLCNIVGGHDYGSSQWPGVKKAVDRAILQRNEQEKAWGRPLSKLVVHSDSMVWYFDR
jgi:hypothetical protein